MNQFETCFNNFKGRKELLENIRRYSMYPIMFYRTNVSIHSRRMQWIAEELLPHLSDMQIIPEKLILLCLVHDDPEIITGDHQLGRKLYTMSEQELERIEHDEKRACNILSSIWPNNINGYSYRNLLDESCDKPTPEGKIMKLIDRLDAFGESLHEIYSGNSCFLRHPELPEGVNPVQTYTKILSESASNPLLRKILDGRHALLSVPVEIDQEQIVRNSSPKTKDSIYEVTNHSHYDAWRQITIKYGREAGIRQLTTKLE